MTSEQADTPTTASRFLNRQLSWHDFNRRVLALAEDTSLPYADRMRFVSSWAANLDEYFLVRVASMRDDARNGRIRIVDDGVTSVSQYEGALDMARTQHAEAQQILSRIRTEMTEDANALHLVDWVDLTPEEQAELSAYYADQVFPILTPLAVDPGHPFPYISTLSLNLGLLIVDPHSGVRRFARVKVPVDLLSRHLPIGDKAVQLEQVISANLDKLFPGVEIIERTVFRVTRDADIAVTADMLDDHDDDLMTAVESELRQRRFGEVVRVEIRSAATPELRNILASEL
ncbi:MAG: RNA degradosome polyphosphate kinase, partial [Acidimicrobiales bacterium]